MARIEVWRSGWIASVVRAGLWFESLAYVVVTRTQDEDHCDFLTVGMPDMSPKIKRSHRSAKVVATTEGDSR
jgi:hypothetical protein